MGPNFKILVADDNPELLETLRLNLIEWDYNPVCSSNGISAWEQLKQEDPPRLALIDLDMPGYNGIELCNLIKQNLNRAFYIIVISGLNDTELVQNAFEVGAHDYIQKPIDFAFLKGKLSVGRRILENHATMEEVSSVMERYAKHVDAISIERAKQLIHLERLSTLGIMAAGVAHEIRNPLGYATTSVGLLRIFSKRITKALSEANMAEEIREDIDSNLQQLSESIDRIDTGVGRIAKIVDGLSNFAKKSSAQTEIIDINESLDAAMHIAQCALRGNVEIIKAYSGNLPKVEGDSQQLEQVFINLYTNAGQALGKQKDAAIEVCTEADNDGVTIIIRDNGPGIPEDILPQIWESFFTTKSEDVGTGLGLAISKEIITQHKGSISATNHEQGGAMFTIHLPCSKSS